MISVSETDPKDKIPTEFLNKICKECNWKKMKILIKTLNFYDFPHFHILFFKQNHGYYALICSKKNFFALKQV